MSDDLIRAQINALIRDEIQDGINEWIDDKENEESTGLGFAQQTVGEHGDELKVNISNAEVDKLIKKYKKIKRKEKSNLSQVKKLGLLDKNGNPLR
jgi:hypothetical protein